MLHFDRRLHDSFGLAINGEHLLGPLEGNVHVLEGWTDLSPDLSALDVIM